MLAAMGLKSVSARARLCCRWHDRRCRVPRPCSPTTARSSVRVPGRLGTGQGNQLGLLLADLETRATAGIARGLRLNTASKPSSTSCLPYPVNHGWAGFQSFDDPVVSSPFCRLPRHRPSIKSAPSAPGAPGSFLPDQRFKPFASSSPLSLTTYFFTGESPSQP